MVPNYGQRNELPMSHEEMKKIDFTTLLGYQIGEFRDKVNYLTNVLGNAKSRSEISNYVNSALSEFYALRKEWESSRELKPLMGAFAAYEDRRIDDGIPEEQIIDELEMPFMHITGKDEVYNPIEVSDEADVDLIAYINKVDHAKGIVGEDFGNFVNHFQPNHPAITDLVSVIVAADEKVTRKKY